MGEPLHHGDLAALFANQSLYFYRIIIVETMAVLKCSFEEEFQAYNSYSGLERLTRMDLHLEKFVTAENSNLRSTRYCSSLQETHQPNSLRNEMCH